MYKALSSLPTMCTGKDRAVLFRHHSMGIFVSSIGQFTRSNGFHLVFPHHTEQGSIDFRERLIHLANGIYNE